MGKLKKKIKSVILILSAVLFLVPALCACSETEKQPSDGDKSGDGENSYVEFKLNWVCNFSVNGKQAFLPPLAIKKLLNAEDIISLIDYDISEDESVVSAEYISSDSSLKIKFTEKGETKEEVYTITQNKCISPIPAFNELADKYEAEAENVNPGATIMLGDSLVANFTNYKSVLDIGEVFNIGMGGSRASYWKNYYLDRLVVPLEPSKIILHTGINEIYNADISAEACADELEDLIDYIHKRLPETEVVVLSIVMPTEDGQAYIPQASALGLDIEANRISRRAKLIEAEKLFIKLCEEREYASFLDASSPFRVEGENYSDKRYFVNDGVHINAAGYKVWTEVLNSAFGEN